MVGHQGVLALDRIGIQPAVHRHLELGRQPRPGLRVAEALRRPRPGHGYPSTGIQIAAAIQTLQHSFCVQNYYRGNGEGQLYVRGAIAQKWRGIVGHAAAADTGYFKDYRYDKRLKFSAPPYFPQWTNAVWGGRYTGEVAPSTRRSPAHR